MFKDKRGIDLLNGTIIFIIINVLFFSLLFVYVARAGDNASFYEQIYSKKIALLIDNSQPGSLISMEIVEHREFFEENLNSKLNIIHIQNNEVNVKLSPSSDGYTTFFFSKYDIAYSFSEIGNSFFLNIRIEEFENE